MHAGESFPIFFIVHRVASLNVQVQITFLTETTQTIFTEIWLLPVMDHLVCFQRAGLMEALVAYGAFVRAFVSMDSADEYTLGLKKNTRHNSFRNQPLMPP